MRIEPLQHRFRFSAAMPGSKSEANRALVLAALSGRSCRVRGIPPSDDVNLMLGGLAGLGFRFGRSVDRGETSIDFEQGEPPVEPTTPTTIDCGLAGTTFRFLCAVAALRDGDWILTGNERMRERPVTGLVDALRSLGVDLDTEGGRPPLRIRGGSASRLGSKILIDPSVSSQFLSALLLIAPLLPEGLELGFDETRSVSRPYVDLTVDCLRSCRVDVTVGPGSIRVSPGTLRPPTDWQIGGDWSGAGAFTVLARLTGSSFDAPNLDPGSLQPDRRLAELLEAASQTTGPIDLSDLPDQAMNVAIFVAVRGESRRLTGLSTLRGKESDRLRATVDMLRAVGVDASTHSETDQLVVEGGAGLRFGHIETEGDHRRAIAGTLLGLLGDGVELDDPSCVSKSHPGFFEQIDRVLQSQDPVVLCGMRAAGKTTTGRALAELLGWNFVDTDQLFEQQHGPIAAFVERNGWQPFRAIERGLCRLEGRSRTVVALGGGALEDPDTRSECRRSSTCVWIQEDLETIRSRLDVPAGPGGRQRPSLTGRPVAVELEEVFERRRPWFESTAHLISAPGLDPQERALRIRSELRSWRRPTS